jgi:hypothetical protein
VQQIHRKEVQQVAVKDGEPNRRRIGRRRRKRRRDQAEDAGAEIGDAEE